MKVHLVKAMVSPVVIYGCEGWTIKKVYLLISFLCPCLMIFVGRTGLGAWRRKGELDRGEQKDKKGTI